MTYHYIVAGLTNTVIGVYGSALRELAFEKAAEHRAKGIACEVFTKSGKRQACTSKFTKEAKK